MVAAIVAAMTLIVTAIGVWFVKRTLDATLNAVEDTSKATMAMERQNELSAELARPWVTIQCAFTRCEEFDGTLLIDANLTFKNVGGARPLHLPGIVKCSSTRKR